MSKIIPLIAGIVCILWFMSIFAPNEQFKTIENNQNNVNNIMNRLNSNDPNTLYIAGYEIPMIGEIFTPIIEFLALLGGAIVLILNYIIALFGLSSYIPIEAYPAFGIFMIIVVLAIIGFIRLGRD